ncbi:hypothetical protein COT40_00140 [Candidatus Peregrinibacteria bacterium CG08_land_8_20_14_0_20_41_10]|nr:MAG: hypothetical protein COT40_00140 [Candidatus Peregrinibacteria bacterium CG08_land_8_20_14_0_20_41_10]
MYNFVITNLPYLIAVVVLLVLLGVRYRKSKDLKRSLEMVFLRIMLPKKESEQDEKKETTVQGQGFREVISVMEHLYSSLYSVSSKKRWNFLTGQDYLSLEYVVLKGELYFYLVVPRRLKTLVEKQVTGFYPDANVEEVEDYNIFTNGTRQVSCYGNLVKSATFSIKTYQKLESDPLNNLSNSLSKLSLEEGVAIQFLLRPAKDGWQKKVKKLVANLRSGKTEKKNLKSSVLGFLSDLLHGKEAEQKSVSSEPKVPTLNEEDLKLLESKSGKRGFYVVMRLVVSARSKEEARNQLRNIKGAFAQFGSPDLNNFTFSEKHSNRKLIINFIYRYFKKGWRTGKIMLLGTEELASLYHFPSIRFNRQANLKWQMSKVAPAPANLPEEGILIGYNRYRGVTQDVRIKTKDRFRHLYIIGQTGTGKSQLLEFLVKQDLESGKGCCVVDPHGDLAEAVLGWVPRERADDVVFFDPSDLERPIGLNMLEGDTDEEKEFIALEAMNMMVKLFGEEIFGPRIQDYFRNGCLTLMSDSEGGAITDIVNLFTDEVFQQYKVAKVSNPVVKAFWSKQMAQTGTREKQEMIPYFAAKFGQFYTNTMMRNIVGQAKSGFRFDEIMDEGKILIAKLSKGLIGDINSDLLGMMLVNKIQVGAMRRQKKAQEKRHDFFLYVDEFQNFVTDSFESILSEARKYRLGLVIGHQYIGQLIDQGGLGRSTNERVKNAVFGNVGNMLCFKIGAQDAEYMSKEMAPIFSDQDLINLENFHSCAKVSVDGLITQPFSVETQKIWELAEKPDLEAAEAYKQLARLKYGRDKEFVDREVMYRMGVL